jgi:hypothetical protein
MCLEKKIFIKILILSKKYVFLEIKKIYICFKLKAWNNIFLIM